ncbi:hypothetical protein TSAR_012472 [Trichomalopsis sarcophagae]|uniref:RNA helicase n=1 Tax=Trichomalopsis sarcophagae TaxID=543379 RepID=A0A232EYE2_9HYME|nr:hypothetical protein TSAR_012472 [Trichomalopsis sarcophagae]
MNSQALTKRYQGFNNSHIKKNNNYNYFVLPTAVSLPTFPIPKDLIPVVMRDLKPFDGITEKGTQFLRVLEKIKNAKEIELTEKNYLQIFKIMLYVEEIQNNKDMRRYDQEGKNIERISKNSKIFRIYVDGLMEERPSVRPNDTVEIRDSASKVLYLLTVTNVMNDHLIANAGERFCQEFSPEKSYHVRFKFQNYSLRCCHYAITLMKMYELTPHFFPFKRLTFNKPSSNEYWFNKTIESNPEQRQAVLNIACKASYPAPYILYGPPGTGKTATVVEAICQVWQENPSEHILVCTPSNAAADVITKRLLNCGIPDHNLYRMYSPSKEGSQIDDAIVGCSNYVDGQVMMLPKELVLLKKIVICTLVACTRLLYMDFREKHFAYVFIDEAGQATEPEVMIPFSLLSSTREGRIGRLHSQVVLAGDPKQLGPGVRSKIAEPILGRSMLERMMDCEPYRKNEHGQYNPSYITKLIRNYRSHPAIIRVSNELFYDNELIACGDQEEIRKAENWPYLVQPKFPIVFHGVEGLEEKDQKSPSIFNMAEVEVVVHYVARFLLGQKFNNTIITQADIGIVTPFSAQRFKLHRALQELDINNIDVGTVELFQGQEKEIIILSTVRSKTFYHDNRRHIGFLSNEKRFNVATTRAKALLIVVGSPAILQTDKSWWHLLKFCQFNNAYRGVKFNLRNDIQDFENAIVNGVKHHKWSINDSNLEVIQLDDGIVVSDGGSVVDENERPSTSRNTSNYTLGPVNTYNSYTNNFATNSTFNHPSKYNSYAGSSTAPRSEVLISNVVMQKMSDLKLEKAKAKKERKEKKKKDKNES